LHFRLESRLQHAGCVQEYVGFQDIPFGAEQDSPLAGSTPFLDWLRVLSGNFWDIPLPNAGETYPTQNAPALMISTIIDNSEPVTIFLRGTSTNLAQALCIDPDIRKNIAAIYFMGGAVYSPGNITNLIHDSSNKVSEWNIIAAHKRPKKYSRLG
jgi:inosine-uridine nucleoside N-ribohydrolase